MNKRVLLTVFSKCNNNGHHYDRGSNNVHMEKRPNTAFFGMTDVY